MIKKTVKLVAGVLLACVAMGSVAVVNADEPVEPTSGLTREEIDAENWSIDMDCAFCHPKEAASCEAAGESAEAADAEEATEAQEAAEAVDAEATESEAADTEDADQGITLCGVHTPFGFTCETCHDDEQGLIDAHQAAKKMTREAKRLKSTEVDVAICADCHDVEALAEATADVDVLTDTNGTTVNPHDLPQVEDHASITCVSCHSMHEDEGAVVDNAPNVCMGCHHLQVYECGTCHE